MAKMQSEAPAQPDGDQPARALRGLLLVPEAPLILLLLGAYWALGALAWLGVGITLLIIGFIARLLALLSARLAYETAHYAEAGVLAHVALAMNPWSADALALRGTIALAQGHPAAAEAALRRSAALLPNQAAVYSALSSALLAQARPGEAAIAARAALALAPHLALGQLYLAEAERACGMPALEVEDRLRAGLEAATAPEDEAALRCALGTLLFAEQRDAEAMLTVRGAEALLPRCRPASQLELRVRLGELMIAQGQLERAREQFRNVAALDPSGRYTGAAWRATHLL